VLGATHCATMKDDQVYNYWTMCDVCIELRLVQLGKPLKVFSNFRMRDALKAIREAVPKILENVHLAINRETLPYLKTRSNE